MKVIGITGIIGSGKSTVTRYILSKGYEVLDADAMYKEMTVPNSNTVAEIVNIFGEKVKNEDGSLNKKALADIVYNDKRELRKLEKVTTEVIVHNIKEIVKQHKEENSIEEAKLSEKNATKELLFIDAPLLIEFKLHEICDYIWLVVADHDTIIKRVEQRDKISKETIEAILNNQIPLKEKEKYATHIVDNSKNIDDLYTIIEGILDNTR